MKVLHVIDHLGLGGAQTLVSKLVKSDKNSMVYSLRKNNEEVMSSCLRVKIRNTRSKLDLGCLGELRKTIEKHNIDILHCHLDKSFFIGYLLKTRYFPNIKLICHEHGGILFQGRSYLFLLKIIKSQVNLFLAVSEGTHDALVKLAKIPPSKIALLYNFVYLDNILKKDQIKRNSIGFLPNDYILGFVGRLNAVKGCRYLIESLSFLPPNYKACIVGDGELRENLISLSERLSLKERVKFLGYVKKPETIFPVFDALIVPSISESFGLSAMEAQFSRVPVIASKVNGLQEIIVDRKTGIFFDSKNSRDLAQKVRLLHDNKKLRRIIINNSFVNAKKYSLSSYRKKLWGLYENVIDF